RSSPSCAWPAGPKPSSPRAKPGSAGADAMNRRTTLATYGLLGALAVVGIVGMWLSDSDVETRALLIFVVDGLALAVAGAVLVQRSPGRATGGALLVAGCLL